MPVSHSLWGIILHAQDFAKALATIDECFRQLKISFRTVQDSLEKHEEIKQLEESEEIADRAKKRQYQREFNYHITTAQVGIAEWVQKLHDCDVSLTANGMTLSTGRLAKLQQLPEEIA
ncbi:MAG: hypothetical protein Q9227_007504 [Pyrenula ochraceoflavens]